MTNTYTEQDVINMINTLQDEESKKANLKYNFDRFTNKKVGSLIAIKDDIKVNSNLWKDINRNIRVFSSQHNSAQDAQLIAEYDNLEEFIKAMPNSIIESISAFGIFSLNIYIK